jgi:hypothetical protein
MLWLTDQCNDCPAEQHACPTKEVYVITENANYDWLDNELASLPYRTSPIWNHIRYLYEQKSDRLDQITSRTSDLLSRHIADKHYTIRNLADRLGESKSALHRLITPNTTKADARTWTLFDLFVPDAQLTLVYLCGQQLEWHDYATFVSYMRFEFRQFDADDWYVRKCDHICQIWNEQGSLRHPASINHDELWQSWQSANQLPLADMDWHRRF